MGKKLYLLAMITTSVMAIIGMAVTMITVHELVHYKEIKNMGGLVNEICVLNLHVGDPDGKDGYVKWDAVSKEQLDYKFSEPVAYVIGCGVYIIFFSLFCYLVIETEKKLKGVKK